MGKTYNDIVDFVHEQFLRSCDSSMAMYLRKKQAEDNCHLAKFHDGSKKNIWHDQSLFKKLLLMCQVRPLC